MALAINPHLNINSIFGIQITFSEDCLEKTAEPRKKHTWNGKKETASYHHRIQKKWNKRHGFVMVPCMFETPYGLIAHPALKPQLERAAN